MARPLASLARVYSSGHQADLNNLLEFPDARFDHIITISVLQAVADASFTLGELCRVLKPGGTLVLSLPKRNSSIFSHSVSEIIRYRIHHLERRTLGKMLLVIAKSFGDRFHHSPTWTVQQAQKMLSEIGFESITIEEGRQLLVVAQKNAA